MSNYLIANAPHIVIVVSGGFKEEDKVQSSYPGINRTLATRLLENFGSIRKIVNATSEEIKEIEGLGEKKNEKIVDLSNKEYEK